MSSNSSTGPSTTMVSGIDNWLAFVTPLMSGGLLWIGNSGSGSVVAMTTSGDIVHTLPSTPASGIAFDGRFIYTSDSQGVITRRNPVSTGPLGTVQANSGGAAEAGDLAYDTKRQRLWRIHSQDGTVRELIPGEGTQDRLLRLSIPDVALGTPRALRPVGVAYDGKRDLLYVSFCESGCATQDRGVVASVNPETGAVVAELFRTLGFAAAGLAYDALSDTLWITDQTMVRNVSLDGRVFSSFARPAAGGSMDALEFSIQYRSRSTASRRTSTS